MVVVEGDLECHVAFWVVLGERSSLDEALWEGSEGWIFRGVDGDVWTLILLPHVGKGNK